MQDRDAEGECPTRIAAKASPAFYNTKRHDTLHLGLAPPVFDLGQLYPLATPTYSSGEPASLELSRVDRDRALPRWRGNGPFRVGASQVGC